MESFTNQQGMAVVEAIIEVIQKNATYLSEIDGAIGDGDHGINMNKGVSQAKEKLADQSSDMATGLKIMSDVMMDDIGGSMGPLYGTFFRQMFRVAKKEERINAEIFNNMLVRALESIKDIGSAKVGDKTMLDTLEPAAIAFGTNYKDGKDFVTALTAMKVAAEKGRDSTKDMVAKVGRSSRLGERSRGVLDAGATSCSLILCAMADSIIALSQ